MNDSAAIGLLVLVGVLAVAAGKAFASMQDYSDSSDGTLPSDSFNDLEGPIVVQNWKTNEYPKYASVIKDAETRWNIPTDLLARVLYQESRFRADVIAGTKRNAVGALGIGQFMPDTARQYGGITDDGQDLRTDPWWSIDAAGHYLHNLYGMFGNWHSALMAYNWGPGNVLKYNRGQKVTVPLETSTYVAQITADVSVA